QAAEVLLDVSLAHAEPGDQEPDHERGVHDRAEPEGLGDVERDPPRRRGRTLPLQQRVQAFVGWPLEAELDLAGGEHSLQGLYGGEVAPGVVTDPDRHPG